MPRSASAARDAGVGERARDRGRVPGRGLAPAGDDGEGVERRGLVPDDGVGEDRAEGRDDLREVARGERVGRQPHRGDAARREPPLELAEVLERVERAVAGVARVDRVREDGVEALGRREQEVAAVVDLDAHPGIGEHAVVDVAEPAVGGGEHGRADLDDADLVDRVAGDRPGGAAAAEADVQHAPDRAGAEQQRQVPLHLLHGVEVGAGAGDVDAVQLEREVGPGGAGRAPDRDRRLGVLVEVDEVARPVVAEDPRGEDDAVGGEERQRDERRGRERGPGESAPAAPEARRRRARSRAPAGR